MTISAETLPKNDRWKLILGHITRRDTLLRTFLSFAVAVFVSLVYSYFNYESYWKTTIFRTQTVDFNILANMLPSKLSQNLIDNDREELQRTLDSNYGLFGVIVTDCQLKTPDCPTQKIIAKPETKRKWAESLTVESLKGMQFDLLRDPPPKTAEWEFPKSYSLDNEARPTGRVNGGKIIGRVYYLRNVPLTFSESINTYLFSSNKNSTSYSYLGAIFYLSLLVWLLLTLLLESLFFASNRAEEKTRIVEEKVRIAEEKIRVEQALKERERILRKEEEILRKEEEILRKEEQGIRGRLERFINLARNSLEQNFASELTNRAQEMRGILSRFQADLQNISHEAKHSYLDTADTTQQLLDLLEDSEKDDQYQQEIIMLTRQMVVEVDEMISSMQRVIGDVRQITEIEGKPIDATEQLKLLESSKEENFKKGYITYTFEIPDHPIFIECNPWRLRSILKNIIYNSNKELRKLYTKDEEFQGEVQVRCYENQSKAYFEVTDNGTGIHDDKVLEKLYRSEERVDQSVRNLNGNGSVIVQQFLELHNGWVEEVSNRPEGGLRVLIAFNLLKGV